ncbi:hypothetical protein OG21DRAFT_1510194 [Imleria badia]|nr:hypothetical protein OG21DRAFT_1510194 [Imleria badia]
MHHLLAGKRSKRYDQIKGEKTDKAQTTATQGLPQVAKELPARMHSPPPHANTEPQPQTGRQRRHPVATPQQVAEQPPATLHTPPQAVAEPHSQTDTEHFEAEDIVIAYVI